MALGKTVVNPGAVNVAAAVDFYRDVPGDPDGRTLYFPQDCGTIAMTVER